MSQVKQLKKISRLNLKRRNKVNSFTFETSKGLKMPNFSILAGREASEYPNSPVRRQDCMFFFLVLNNKIIKYEKSKKIFFFASWIMLICLSTWHNKKLIY